MRNSYEKNKVTLGTVLIVENIINGWTFFFILVTPG